MKSSRLILVEDAAAYSSAGNRPPASSPRAAPALKGEIVQLPHPKTGRQQRYLVSGGHLLELQRIKSPLPCSWFVDQTVQSDGSLLLASRVDVCFFLLPLLGRNGGRYSPLSQYLVSTGPHDAAVHLLGSLDGVRAALSALCDVNSVMGDDTDDLLFRLNKPKAAAHLAARARRLARVLQGQAAAQQSRLKAQMGSFSATSASTAGGGGSTSASSSSSAAAAGSGAVSSGTNEPLQPEHVLTALGLLSEYISDAWTEEVAAVLGVPLASILPHVARTRAMAAQAAAAAAAPKPPVRVSNHGGDDSDDDMDQQIEAQLGHDGGGAAASSSSSSSAAAAARSSSGGGGLNTSTSSSVGASAYDGPLPDEEDGEGGGSTSPGLNTSAGGGSAKAAAWNAAALDDPSSVISKYVRPTSTSAGAGAGGGSGEKKKPAPNAPLSAAQKKLAASAKGSQSLSSFFGKK